MSIIEQTVQNAMRLLKATKAKYIIVMPDGTTHSEGDLHLAEVKARARKAGPLPHGTYSTMCKPYNNMAVGDVVEFDIPPGGTGKSLHSGVTAHFINLWGKGAMKSCFNKKTNKVEVLRIG
ncbi:MAG: hypothetical protein ACK4Y5_10320 [Acetobacteraceae bacterium]|jgi:hypothetical protein